MLIDTSVWSLALRRQHEVISPREGKLTKQLRTLIDEDRVLMIGPIRQELLSGIRSAAQFDRLSEGLRSFPDAPLETADYETAAAMGNECRAAGTATSAIDLLICAAAFRRQAQLLTTDRDFERYAEILPLKLFPIGEA